MNAYRPITEKFNSKNKQSSGFTLVELMVVLGMLAILTGIAAPSINAIVNSSGVMRATHELISDMYLARIQAIRSGTSATVAFNTPGLNQYTITWNNGANTKTVDLGNFRGGVSFEPNPPGGASPVPVNSVIFTSRGFAQQTPAVGWGNIYLTDEGTSRVMRIETTFAGMISELRWSPTTNTWTYN